MGSATAGRDFRFMKPEPPATCCCAERQGGRIVPSHTVAYTVPDLLVHGIRHAHGPAVIDGDVAVSYQELIDKARRCADVLADHARRGDRVALLLPRSAQALAAYFGAHLAALVPVFIHEQLRPRQIASIVDHAGA